MTNMKLPDELFTIRQEIKRLQAREAEIKEALSLPDADMSGAFTVAHFVKRGSSRFDRKAAEAELGPLDRFDMKGETVALMVSELVRAEE